MIWKQHCKVVDCFNSQECLGMCGKHYQRMKYTGRTDSINDLTPLERLLKKTILLKNGCLEYTGTKTKNGTLRQHGYKGKMWPAARLSWFLQRGEIKKGYVVCHRCDYPPCINIDHLFVGTYKDNSQDASKKFRLTHGEDHHWHKLSEKDVLKMRQLYLEGLDTFASLGRKFKVNESTSAKIIKGKLWKHLLVANT